MERKALRSREYELLRRDSRVWSDGETSADRMLAKEVLVGGNSAWARSATCAGGQLPMRRHSDRAWFMTPNAYVSVFK